ncbi:hypothetical protein BH10PSE1_BH10PSE1_27190 [soil metagenome]
MVNRPTIPNMKIFVWLAGLDVVFGLAMIGFGFLPPRDLLPILGPTGLVIAAFGLGFVLWGRNKLSRDANLGGDRN